MSRDAERHASANRVPEALLSLAVILAVFGLVLALILAGYNPAVSTGTAAAASLTAAELARRVQKKKNGKRSKGGRPRGMR
jgi:membrane protein implicated in regulation of membrane protease activity